MRLNFETEYFAISYHNMQPSFDPITVSHKKQKERSTKTTWKARELTDAYARFTGAYQRLLSLNHLTRNMRRQNAPLLIRARKPCEANK